MTANPSDGTARWRTVTDCALSRSNSDGLRWTATDLSPAVFKTVCGLRKPERLARVLYLCGVAREGCQRRIVSTGRARRDTGRLLAIRGNYRQLRWRRGSLCVCRSGGELSDLSVRGSIANRGGRLVEPVPWIAFDKGGPSAFDASRAGPRIDVRSGQTFVTDESDKNRPECL